MKGSMHGAPLSTARKYASQGQSALHETASDVAQRLGDFGEAAADKASEYYRQGRQAIQHSAQNLERYVEEQPIRSTLVVIGLGCLICAMLIRR